MQIHEITEGLLSNVGRGFVSGLVGADIPQSQASIDRQAAQAADKLRAQGYGTTSTAVPTQRIVVSLQQPGQEIASKYYKTGNIWTNELGAVITNAKQKAYLDGLIPTHGRKEAIAPAATTASTPRRVSRQRVGKSSMVKRSK